MLAAGGTIPENVGINNVDVHDAFGVGLTFMVNTWTPNSKAFGQYNTPTNVMQPKQEVISYTLDHNDSRLDKSKLVDNCFKPLPDWKDALKRYLEEIKG